LTRPQVRKGAVPMETWVKDWDCPLYGDRIAEGVLIESHSTGKPMSDSDNSVSFKVCLLYPRCKSCTEREVCPVSNFKK